jgi:ankyrin repeat protein
LIEYIHEPDIFHACFLARDERALALLDRDRSLVSKSACQGWTPLFCCCLTQAAEGDEAALERLRRIVQRLLDLGADPMVKEQALPFRPAASYALHYPSLVGMLTLSNAEATDLLRTAILNEAFDAAGVLLTMGAELDRPDVQCLLVDQTHWGRVGCVDWLLAHGVDANTRDHAGRTALHWAASRGVAPQVVETLLRHGADVNASDSKGHTPLVLALKRKKVSIVDLLRRHGAKP